MRLDWLAAEGTADGIDGPNGSSCGLYDRADVGVEMDAPLLTGAIGDLAVNRAGSQRPLRAAVGRLQIPVLDQDERRWAPGCGLAVARQSG